MVLTLSHCATLVYVPCACPVTVPVPVSVSKFHYTHVAQALLLGAGLGHGSGGLGLTKIPSTSGHQHAIQSHMVQPRRSNQHGASRTADIIDNDSDGMEK